MPMDLRREEDTDSAGAWTPALDADVVAAPGADRDFVASLARGLAVIQAFTNHQQRLTIAKISQRTGIARAAVRRYLHTLAELGFVVTHDGCRYSLLPKVISLGQAYLSATAMPPVVQAHLDALAEEVGEACSLAVLDHLDIVYVARANSSSVMSPRFNVGGRLPAHCTSIGRVLLADLPAGLLEHRLKAMRFIPYTSRTVRTPAALLECLASARDEGFAIADQQLEAGFRSIAVAVRNSAGDITAGLNVIVPVARASLDQMRARYLQPLTTAAAGLGAALAP